KVSMPEELKPILKESLQERKPVRRSIHLDDGADGVYTAHAIPFTGRDSKQPIAILVVASSHRELGDLQSRIRNIGLLVAAGGILLSIIAVDGLRRASASPSKSFRRLRRMWRGGIVR